MSENSPEVDPTGEAETSPDGSPIKLQKVENEEESKESKVNID